MSDSTTIPMHWRETVLASAALLENTKCPIDALQARALRRMAHEMCVCENFLGTKETEAQLIDIAMGILNENNGKIGKRKFRADATAVVRRVLRAVSEGAAACYQLRVGAWIDKCFSQDVVKDQRERGDRLLEEVLELLQSHGYDPSRVATLTQYVFNRPVGDPFQEVGGVMVTLAAYCRTAAIDMRAAGEMELDRINTFAVMEKIRIKQASKRGLHTPLPVRPLI